MATEKRAARIEPRDPAHGEREPHKASTPKTRALGIVGASARAAAHSAIRAGFAPHTWDRFGDADLAAVAPHELRSGVGSVPVECLPYGTPWIYTGGLEHQSDTVRDMARKRPLWGVNAPSLERLAATRRLIDTFDAAGLPMPETILEATCPPRDPANWVVRRAGKKGVRRATDCQPAPGVEVQYQRLVHGVPAAAIFVAHRSHSEYLGSTEQLVGEPWLHAPAFTWCGSVGPLRLSRPSEARLAEAAERLRVEFGLRGIFGIDFVIESEISLDRHLRESARLEGRLVPLEVNPRYTGSVEVLEHAQGIHAIARHAIACDDTPHAVPRRESSGPLEGFVAKAILYAERHFESLDSLVKESSVDPRRLPSMADLPPAGTRTPPGERS